MIVGNCVRLKRGCGVVRASEVLKIRKCNPQPPPVSTALLSHPILATTLKTVVGNIKKQTGGWTARSLRLKIEISRLILQVGSCATD